MFFIGSRPKTDDSTRTLMVSLSFADEEDFTSILRDRTHIDETLRLATEEKAKDYAGGFHVSPSLQVSSL